MKKRWFKTLVIILAVLIVYIVFNQIDSKATPAQEEQGSPPALTASDGFYLLCALQEPESVNIDDTRTVERYNKLFSFHEKDKKSTEHLKGQFRRTKLFPGGPKSDKQKKAISWTNDPRQNNCLHVLQHKETLLQLKEEKKVFIERYQRMLASETFNDLSSGENLDFELIPPLLQWLHITKLYTYLQVLDALEGNWQPAVTNLIRQINFVKKHNRSSRLFITSLIFKAVAKIPLWELSSLMNQPNCPDEVYEQILLGLPDMPYNEFGTTSLEFYEGLPGIMRYFQKKLFLRDMSGIEKILAKLFMQNNRTQKYYEDFYRHLIRYEKTPPYKWEGDFKPKNPKSGLFWWLQNPMGKIMISKYLNASAQNNITMVLKSYSLLTTHDMVRISADLHLNYNPDKSIPENLKALKTYQTLLDPCSGKPYIWNEKKQILYSLGTDRDDDGGKGYPITSWDTDFVLPVILYLNK